MARASIVTKLSLDRWAQIIGIHPLHFNGVSVVDLAPPTLCSTPWLQYPWQQADRVARETIAEAIAQAEADIESQVGFRLLPSWEVDEWNETIRPYRPEFVNLSATGTRGYNSSIRTQWGWFITGGVERKTLIPNPTAIVWSDPDLDVAYEELGTITVATTVTDPCELRVYYPGKSGDDTWEIRPANVVIAGGVATITFRRELCVLEALQEALNAEAVDGDNTQDANFLATVDVYRRYNDPQTQVSFLWEPLGDCSCGSTTCIRCQQSTQAGCLYPRGDLKYSRVVFQPGTWDAITEDFSSDIWAVSHLPDVVRLYYQAGLSSRRVACPDKLIDPSWERVIAYYACTFLDRPPCECEAPHNSIERWRTDLAFASGADQFSSYSLSPGDLDNPFGTRAGAVFAWKRVVKESLVGVA